MIANRDLFTKGALQCTGGRLFFHSKLPNGRGHGHPWFPSTLLEWKTALVCIESLSVRTFQFNGVRQKA